ncbi:ABC transporter permease [Nocardioides sp. TRM66260-LWL]|uniref:ABC transporter permease n=1 Tax=Nocardioides sp. TRM66260-LWL TaxID=2874478 RepID=UPI001CC3C0C8|nr:ABC transporter permease [Nocardioides sp. TRM66260-LWL]MBZ5735314.1 ABC transporter permease [Nocardioides sp. TRM66260-LWL]
MTDILPRPHATEPPEPDGAAGTASATPKASRLERIGDFVDFMLEAIREIPYAVRAYPAEIMRHCGLLIRQNSLVVLFMLFMLGAVLGLTAHFLFTSIGIDSYIAAVNSVGGMRGIIQVVFGWIVAAKVGCGIVAELGAMRISDEIDALETMGIRSIAFLVSTRIVAMSIVMPLLFIVALSVNFYAGYLFNVDFLNTVSSGGFEYFLFLFQNGRDFAICVIWSFLLSLMLVVVSCYFGFTASGGPVGVGRNTAQSMLVNLVGISILSMMLVQLFYGNDPNAPIGN